MCLCLCLCETMPKGINGLIGGGGGCGWDDVQRAKRHTVFFVFVFSNQLLIEFYTGGRGRSVCRPEASTVGGEWRDVVYIGFYSSIYRYVRYVPLPHTELYRRYRSRFFVGWFVYLEVGVRERECVFPIPFASS